MKLHAIHRFTALVLISLLPTSLCQAAPSVDVVLKANGIDLQGESGRRQ
jgi:hypothetical protein